MKRFYTLATVDPVDGGLGVFLDGRPVRTPGKRILTVPHRALADALAGEWLAQGETVDPSSMGLTRLSNSATDVVAERRAEIIDEVAKFAETDLLCYRAEEPEDLALAQDEAWQPLLDWMDRDHGVRLQVTRSIMPVAQSAASLAGVRDLVSTFADFPLTGLHAASAAMGSVVVGLGMATGRVGPDAAFEISVLDESYQTERWGEDSEAAARRENLRAEITNAARFLSLCEPA